MKKSKDKERRKNKPDKTCYTNPNHNPVLTYFHEDINSNNKFEVIGNFVIKEHLPYEMTKTYVEIMKNQMIFDGLKNEMIREAVNQMYFVSYLAAISHILHSSNPFIYIKYKFMISFREIKNLELPLHLNSLLNMIGTIDCKLGKLEMKYAEVYLEGWATLAHEYYIQNNNDNPINTSDLGKQILFPVWNSLNGTTFIIQKYSDWYNKHLGEFGIKVHDDYIMVSTPRIGPENFEKYVIQPEYTYKDVDRDTLINSFNSIRQWINHNYQGNVLIDGTVYCLRDNLDKCELRDHLASDFRHFSCVTHYVNRYFKTNKCLVTNSGSVAQLVSKEKSDYEVTCPVPISEGEMWVGFLSRPCLEYYIKPETLVRFLNLNN